MKLLAPFRANKQVSQRLEIALLLVLTTAAVYLWTTSYRAERALRRASFPELVAASKREPNNPRVFFHLGTRLRNFGQLGPARAAFERAATLDHDYEDAWLAWAALAGTLGKDQEAFAVLTTYVKRHPKSAQGHFALALFYHEEDALERAYEESLASARLNRKDAAAWRLAGVEAITLRLYPKAEEALRQAIQQDPKDWRSHLALGNALLGQRRDPEAFAAFQQAAALAPNEAAPVRAWGIALLARARNTDEIEAARQTLLRAAKLAPNFGAVHLALGRCYARQQRWAEARQSFEQAARLTPAEPEVHFELRRVYQRLGDAKQAARAMAIHQQTSAYQTEKYNLLTRIYQVKNDPQTRLQLARICAAHGDYTEAAREYRRLIARAPDMEAAKKELAELQKRQPQVVHHQVALPLPRAASAESLSIAELLHDAGEMLAQKRYEESARAYLSALVRAPKSAVAYEGLGLALSAQGNQEEAFRVLNRAISLNPKLQRAGFALAGLYFNAGFPDEAARRLEMLVREAPDNAQYLHALGDCYKDNPSRYQQARDILQRAAMLAPTKPNYLRDLAKVEFNLHRYPDAEAHYRQALRLAPSDADTLVALGAFLLDYQPTPVRQQEAERLLKQVVASQVKNPDALLGLGRIALDRGDTKQAVASLEEAVGLLPGRTDGWYHLARAYDRRGDRARAEACRTSFRNLSDYSTELYNTEESARNNLKDPALRLKLARLYAKGGQQARAINQYQMCLTLAPKNTTVQKELEALVNYLQSQGRMPAMTALNGMVLASVKPH